METVGFQMRQCRETDGVNAMQCLELFSKLHSTFHVAAVLFCGLDRLFSLFPEGTMGTGGSQHRLDFI